jgi:hypothetical protein
MLEEVPIGAAPRIAIPGSQVLAYKLFSEISATGLIDQ